MAAHHKDREKQSRVARQQRTVDAMFRLERDQILRELDVEKMTAFLIKWKQKVPEKWGKPDAALAIMHRARLALGSFHYDEKLKSAQWLVAHLYSLPVGMMLKDGILFGLPNDTTLPTETK